MCKNKPIILVMETSKYMGKVIGLKLQERGFQVSVVSDLTVLLKTAREIYPSLILTDINNPHTFKQCMILRKDPLTKNIPILFHLLHPTAKSVREAVKVGAKTIIIKPAAIDTIVARIVKHLNISESLVVPEDENKFKIDRNDSVSENMGKLLKRQSKLRAFPTVIVKALKIAQDADSSAIDLAKIVKSDSAVAGAVLKKANSAYYGSSKAISGIQEAITRIGFEESKKILIGMSVVKMFDPQNHSINFTRKGFWEHSLACGIVAALLAQKSGITNPAVAFTAGILHDIGKIIFDENVDAAFEQAVEVAARKHKMIFETEKDIFGFSHNELGYVFLQALNIPSLIFKAALYHNTTNLASNDLNQQEIDLVRIIWFANIFVKASGYTWAGDSILGNSSINVDDIPPLTIEDYSSLMEQMELEIADFKKFLGFEEETENYYSEVDRSSRKIFYHNPFGPIIDVVEISMAKEGFVVQRSQDLEVSLQEACRNVHDATLLVQLDSSTMNLTELAVRLADLPEDLPIICIGHRAEIRMLQDTNLQFSPVLWPLSIFGLRSALLNSMQESALA
ncbi:HDOD domain-containing protein [Planctomycetota bacterium]